MPLVGMLCEHTFVGTARDGVTLWLATPNGAIDPLLELIPPDGGEPETSNDDANFPDDRNSIINGHVLQQGGLYTIRARSYRDQGTGDYVLFLVKSQCWYTASALGSRGRSGATETGRRPAIGVPKRKDSIQ